MLFRCLENASLVYARTSEGQVFYDKVKACRLRNTMTYKQIDINSRTVYPLEILPPVGLFLDCLRASLEDGLNDRQYFETKLNELFFLMNVYYTDEALAGFFYPLLNDDFPFINRILHNRYKVFSVNEMAALVELSPDDFRLHFKRIFKALPSRWMNRERSRLIMHKLTLTDKPLRLISEECGFLSLSYLDRFCKKHLHNSPFKIRNQAKATKNDMKKLI
jgi:AraC-like DNA-binding protein